MKIIQNSETTGPNELKFSWVLHLDHMMPHTNFQLLMVESKHNCGAREVQLVHLSLQPPVHYILFMASIAFRLDRPILRFCFVSHFVRNQTSTRKKGDTIFSEPKIYTTKFTQ